MLEAKSSNVRRVVRTAIEFFADTYEREFGFHNGPPVHDLLTIIYAIDPSAFGFTTESIVVDKVEDFADHRGRTRRAPTPEGREVLVASELDTIKIWDYFFQAVERAESRENATT